VWLDSGRAVAALSVQMSLRGVAMEVRYAAEIVGGAVGLAAATAMFRRSDTGSASGAALVDSFRHVFILVAIAASISLVVSLRLVALPQTDSNVLERA
jgi:hypothetical protein